MAFDATFAVPPVDVFSGDTITLDYPNARSAEDYASSGHKAYVYNALRTITPSFGGSNITFTWTGATIPAGTRVPVELALAESGGVGTVAWADVTGKPNTFTPATHSHAISDVTGLQTALDAKAAASHSHAISDVTGLQTALDGKQASATALSAIAALTPAANKVPYFTGSSAAAITDLTATGRTIIGLGAGTDGYVLKMVSGSPAWAAESGGGGGSPGGSNTQFQFNNSSAFGGTAGFTWNSTTKNVALAQGSITTTADGFSYSATWAGSDSSQVFRGFDFNATLTTYDSTNSYAFGVRNGGVLQACIRADGNFWIGANRELKLGGATPSAASSIFLYQSRVSVNSSGCFGISGGSDAVSVPDTALLRDGASHWGMRSVAAPTTATQLSIYGTYSGATNHERLALVAGPNNHRIQAEKGSGGGSLRPVIFQAYAKGGDPDSNDLPVGYGGFFINTSSGLSKLWINRTGTPESATLA